jgi:hypothetical protein
MAVVHPRNRKNKAEIITTFLMDHLLRTKPHSLFRNGVLNSSPSHIPPNRLEVDSGAFKFDGSVLNQGQTVNGNREGNHDGMGEMMILGEGVS